MAQTAGLDPENNVKYGLSAIPLTFFGLLASTERMVPEGCLHMRPFQWHHRGNWIFPQSLDNLLPTRLVAKNPLIVLRVQTLIPKTTVYRSLSTPSNLSSGTHLDQY